MPEHKDIQRLRAEYEKRSKRFSESDRYSLFNRVNLFAVQQRQQDVLSILHRFSFNPLGEYSVLDLGCGFGNVISEYMTFGAKSYNIIGIDILLKRLFQAKQQYPHLSLACADGRYLPVEDGKFDLVLQYTVFSSILDQGIKQQLAQEMLRGLNLDRGMILWYDFWLNPTNPHTRGIRPNEIRTLFPKCSFHFHRVTLAPPIARWLVPISWMAAEFFEKLRIFNSHYLVAIRPNNPEKVAGDFRD